uniref:adhesion G protein-coupled receptor E5 n=1 Tax=Panthera onca TaxID=9690 RepID=UPI002955C70C|nr:adhesion G protein-coupled receptor E5 [Panthera onca]
MGVTGHSVFFLLYVLCVLWTLFEAESQKTSDCARWCPLNSRCVNATACRCSPGFTSLSGDIFTNRLENCDDINECGPPLAVSCGKFADCQNTEGSYHCECSPGYQLASGAKTFRNESENTCQGVDKCQLKPRLCKGRSICINTQGNYTCGCPPGLELNLSDPNVCSGRATSCHPSPQNLITSVDKLLEVPSDLDALALPERHKMATYLLSELERVLRTLAKAMPGASFTYHSPSNTELSLMIQEQGDGYTTIGQSHARMLLDWAVAAAARDSDPTVMGIFSSCKMQKLLANASLELDPEMKAKLKDLHQSPVRGAQYELLSAVNLVFLSNTNTEHLDSPVTFAFSHPMKMPGPRQGLVCAFWKSDDRGGGHWNTTGCWTRGTSNNSTTCQCNHLSSFAILMAHYDIEDPKLALITKVGLALSLVCLLLCILTFLLVRPIQGSRTTVHLHLCICLFVGSAIFLAGIENEGGQAGLRCRLVAGLLHYCFLAAFCWMSLEGLELYFLVVRVFHGQGLSKCWLYLIGYGVPLLIVAISAAVRHEHYGRSRYCWLNPKDGFLWSFLGPVIFIVLFNAVIFVTTVWKLTQKFSEINPDMKKLKKARVLTITAVAQLFLLGSTWVFGLFLFNPHSWVLTYTFTILNCLQGFFLFIFHCLLNKKVREEYRKWAGWVTGNRYSEFTTSSSNQTQAHRPSESGM